MRCLFTTLTLLAGAAAGAACLPEAPEKPTWADDVWPILRTNCVRCHGEKPLYGAPDYFRLDNYTSARFMAALIGARAGTMGDMPPGGPELNAYQRQVLENWANQGVHFENPADDIFPPLVDDASPRANTAPTITGSVSVAGDVMTLDYEIRDAEHDPVTAALFLDGTDNRLRVAKLSPGRQRVTFDLSRIAPGSYGVFVDTNDGMTGTLTRIGGDVVVAHANTRPAVSLDNRLVYTDADEASTACAGPQCFQVVLQACLPAIKNTPCPAADEAESYSATLVAERPGSSKTLATSVPLVRAGGSASTFIPWDPAQLAAGRWTLRVTVSDGTHTVEVSDRVEIGHGTSTRKWAGDVENIVGKHCLPCHRADRANVPPAVFVGDFAFSDRDSLLAIRDYAYEHVIVQRSMPPPSAKALVNVDQPSETDRQAIGDWILGGAP